MKKKNVIVLIIAILIVTICGFLLFRGKLAFGNANQGDTGGLQLGLTDEPNEDSKKEEGKNDSEDDTSTPTNNDESENQTSTDSQEEVSEIPEGGMAIDNGDGSVNIIINDDEDTFGE